MVRATLLGVFLTSTIWAADIETPAANAINALGLDLLRDGPAAENEFFSPYSIQIALAMTSAGAAGETRKQMERTLHYSGSDINASLAAVNRRLNEIAKDSAAKPREGGPITLYIANRLFAQQGFAFNASYLELLRTEYHAPLDIVDFASEPAAVTRKINRWVSEQTRSHISDLIPHGALNGLTRLVLANAIYLNAPWENAFEKDATSSREFHLASGESVTVPTMARVDAYGYGKGSGFTAVSIPYIGGKLQLLILLPAPKANLAALQRRLSARALLGFARLRTREVDLQLPKFNLESKSIDLKTAFVKLGMEIAFDSRANFEGIAPAKGADALHIGEIFHKAFLSVGEKGTEASAATAVVMEEKSVIEEVKSVEVHVDRPFLFAVQEKSTGACLFLGRVTDPR